MVPRSMCKDDAEFLQLLRDEFAAKALQGLLADSNVSAERNKFAESAYELADAMLKAREQ